MSAAFKKKLGIIFLITVPVFYLLAGFIFLLPFSTGAKSILSAVFIAIAEGNFLIAAFLLGKELFTKYKGCFHPKNWLKKYR